MVHGLRRIPSHCLPLSALLSFVIGPSAAAAEARYEQRACKSRIEIARKAAEAQKSPVENADASETPAGNPDSGERVFEGFVAPATCKPTDTHGSGGAAMLLAVPILAAHQPAPPGVLICNGLHAPAPLHRAAHHALSPPLR